MDYARPPALALPLSHAPAVSSRLASSSSPSRGPLCAAHPSSDSQLPSSPTTSAFYRPASALRPPPGRVYKPTTSTRRASLAGPGSSPAAAAASSLRAAQENARRARARPRALQAGEGAPDGPGGWGADGEWEEWDEEELARLEAEVRKERRRWEWEMRVREEQAREEGRLVDPDLEDPREREEEMLVEEPPLDILYAEDDDPLPSPALYPSSTRRLPSLTSAPGSSASSAGALSEPEPDGDEDSDMDLGLPPSAHREDDLAAFSAALRSAPCPACAAAPPGALHLSDAEGLRCAACGWGIPPSVLAPLAGAFVSHGAEGHTPLLSWTRFTGTVVLCGAAAGGGCDEQFAA
ncbi:hypothetical protein JCM10449v2_006957 [Rhodotorula kratochvilovae]